MAKPLTSLKHASRLGKILTTRVRLFILRFYLTLRRPSSESALQEEGTASTNCSPGRIEVVRTVVRDVEPTPSAGVDGGGDL
jgi:hypothetical protein